MANRALRRIQLGKETTAGTATTATAIWRGPAEGIEDKTKVEFVPEDVGIIPGTDRAMIPQIGAGLKMPETPATFEQLLYVLEASIKKVTTGVTDTGGSGMVYTYTFPTTASPTIQTFTIEAGDDQQAEEMEYAYVQSWELTGKMGEAVLVTAEWDGRQATKTTFTGSITPPTVEEVLFSKGKLYIDDIGGTMGTTQKSGTLLGMKLAVKPGLAARFAADGNLYFSQVRFGPSEVTLDITFEHDATAVAEKDAFRAKSTRQVRLLWEGTALTTAGSSYSKRTLKIDLWGKWEKFSVLEDDDGNDTVTGTLRARYNLTKSKFAEIVVVNEVASVP